MLLVIGDQVIEREAIVTSYEIDALFSLALLITVNLRASDYSVGEWCRHVLFAAEKPSDIVAKPTIPFSPAVTDETADLIKAGGVPGLGYQLGARQSRV